MALLTLPDKRQTTDFTCGAVALRVALTYDQIPARKWILRLSHPVIGMSAEVAAAVAHAAYDGRILTGSFDVPLLKHFADRGRPVLCLITDPVGGGGHWVVSRGVARRRVHVHCPTRGPESWPVTEFEAAWHLTDPVGGWSLVRHGIVGFP